MTRRRCTVCRARSRRWKAAGWIVVCAFCLRAIAEGAARALLALERRP